jgi:DNA replication and repair protein RecF
MLLVGPPADRRRWLDTAIAQVDRAYMGVLSGYEALLARRNALLRRAQAGAAHPDELTFWDERLAPPALEVLGHRRGYLSELAPIAAAEFDRMEGSGAVTLAYLQTITADDELAYTAALRDRRTRDVERGLSGAGPHRDDILIELDGHSLGAFASRGQIRLAALAVKFAQFALAERRVSTAPVMLLDDIAAELDPDHRRLLLSRLRPDVQTVVTTADPAALDSESLRNAPRLVVSDGAIRSDHVAA